ncbi:Protein CBG26339 [Caenorhabditis briggsae]|uniref:Protein CBG26339 n=1 Tax=Caenorhabditis briggsae TaxID=6238 RepID=B6IGB1_CAEBR|nr:Protein CBG26339 [Caenorhabditis briggsae]CAR98941.1 Protein CBG26339 [Caenorhabditis briggsae]
MKNRSRRKVKRDHLEPLFKTIKKFSQDDRPQIFV